MWISGECWKKRGTSKVAISETFSSDGPSEFLVVNTARWDEYQRKMSVQKEEPRRMLSTLQSCSGKLS